MPSILLQQLRYALWGGVQNAINREDCALTIPSSKAHIGALGYFASNRRSHIPDLPLKNKYIVSYSASNGRVFGGK